MLQSATFNADEDGNNNLNHRKTLSHNELIEQVVMPYDGCKEQLDNIGPILKLCDPVNGQTVRRPIPISTNQVDHFHIDREQNVSPIASDTRLDENNISPVNLQNTKLNDQVTTPQK